MLFTRAFGLDKDAQVPSAAEILLEDIYVDAETPPGCSSDQQSPPPPLRFAGSTHSPGSEASLGLTGMSCQEAPDNDKISSMCGINGYPVFSDWIPV